jgi:cellobiose phosphorylase
MYRLALESLLGLKLEGDQLHLAPRLLASWPGFKLRYRYRETVYQITVVRGESGAEQADHIIPLVDDRREHLVEVRVPAAKA